MANELVKGWLTLNKDGGSTKYMATKSITWNDGSGNIILTY